MLGRPHATIQPVEDGNLGERHPYLVLQPPINTIGRRKPCIQSKTNTWEGQMFFSDTDGGHRRGRSGRGRFDLSHEGNSKFRQENGSHRGTFARRGSFRTEQGRRTTPPATYVQLLRQNRSSRRGVPKKMKRVGFNKPETHKLCRERGIRCRSIIRTLREKHKIIYPILSTYK